MTVFGPETPSSGACPLAPTLANPTGRTRGTHKDNCPTHNDNRVPRQRPRAITIGRQLQGDDPGRESIPADATTPTKLQSSQALSTPT